MKRLDDISLTQIQRRALAELKHRLVQDFGVEDLVLYGSAARDEADAESDVDLLVLTSDPLSRPERHRITDLVFEVNLEHGTNFSTLVVAQASWDSGAVSVLPLREEIAREGIPI